MRIIRRKKKRVSHCATTKSRTANAAETGISHRPSSCAFSGFREIVVPEGEEGAANALRVNNALVVGARFRRTIDLLAKAGYCVVALPTDEIGKIDAGLSCMSLRRRALKDT